MALSKVFRCLGQKASRRGFPWIRVVDRKEGGKEPEESKESAIEKCRWRAVRSSVGKKDRSRLLECDDSLGDGVKKEPFQGNEAV